MVTLIHPGKEACSGVTAISKNLQDDKRLEIDLKLYSQDQIRILTIKTAKPEIMYGTNFQFTVLQQPETQKEQGICIADLTGDGCEDIYCVVSGNSNKLLQRHPEFPDMPDIHIENAEQVGIIGPTLHDSGKHAYDVGASAVDADNDGDQDLLVTSLYGPNLFYKQRAPGRFHEVTQEAGLLHDDCRSHLGIWADIDRDGDVDLFIPNADSSSSLYLNNGAGIFKDITRRAGLGDIRHAVCAAFSDIDNDGDADLFIGRSGRKNLLYRNESNRFKDQLTFVETSQAANVSGPDSLSKTTSCFFADVNNDANTDLFVTNLILSNQLYLGCGDGVFTNVTRRSGLTDSALSTNSIYLDADHDGHLDIFVTNRGQNVLLQNDGTGRFTPLLQPVPKSGSYPTGLAMGDLNDNGAQDLYIGDLMQESYRLKNTQSDSRYLRFSLTGTQSNRDALGARIYLYPAGQIGQTEYLAGMREIQGGFGPNSTSSKTAHFGTGDFKAFDAEIVFPSGIKKSLYGIKPGRTLNVVEQQGLAVFYALAGKWIERTTHDPRKRLDFSFFILFTVLTSGMTIYLTAKKWFNGKAGIWIAGPANLIYLFLYIILYNNPSIIQLCVPCLFGFGFLGGGVLYLRSLYIRQDAFYNLNEKLFMEMRAFFHGEWGARKLGRINFYCSNLPSSPPVPVKIKEGTLDAVHDYYTVLLPAIDQITDLTKTTTALSVHRKNISDASTALAKSLNDLKTAVHTPDSDLAELCNEISRQIQTLLGHLTAMRHIIQQQFVCFPVSLVETSVKRNKKPGIIVQVTNQTNGRVIARIRSKDFSQIFDNLFFNAQRAVIKGPRKHIQIKIDATEDFINIHIADTGPGIEAPIRNVLFDREISTSHGGFGLFHARQVLNNFGGNITLTHSSPENGTVFLLQLKRIDND